MEYPPSGCPLKVDLPVEPRTYEIVGSEKKDLMLGLTFARPLGIHEDNS